MSLRGKVASRIQSQCFDFCSYPAHIFCGLVDQPGDLLYLAAVMQHLLEVILIHLALTFQKPALHYSTKFLVGKEVPQLYLQSKSAGLQGETPQT